MVSIARIAPDSGRRTGLRFGLRLLSVLAVPWVCLSAASAGAADLKVAFLAPDPAGESPHWDRTVRVMQAAADDLEIDLQVAYSKTNTYTNRKKGLALLTDDEKPDYFMTGYWSGATETLLKQAEQLGVGTFIVTSGVVPADRDPVGKPRGIYRQWVGQMTSADRQAGYELAAGLIEKARRIHPDRVVRVVGLGGYGDAAVEIARREGLERRIAESPKTELGQFLFAEWATATAYRGVAKILESSSPPSVIWSASDNMALGAIRAVSDAGQTPGRDVIVGGINWSLDAIEAVINGDMQTTLGGHFLQGAWALVLLHDYHQGEDFADDLGLEFQTPLRPITGNEAQTYFDILDDADWATVDFKRFSKIHNPQLEQYSWPLEQVFAQLKGASRN